MAPVAAADQSQHERGHGVNVLGRRSRMQWAHRRQPVHGSSVMRQLVARPLRFTVSYFKGSPKGGKLAAASHKST